MLQILQKTPVLESLLNKVADLRALRKKYLEASDTFTGKFIYNA